jgi:hypothetical protein
MPGGEFALRSGRDDKGEGGASIEHLVSGVEKLQIPPLRYPGFPVKLGGVVALHAPFFTEGRTTWPRPVLRGRKSGYATVGMTKGRAALPLNIW